MLPRKRPAPPDIDLQFPPQKIRTTTTKPQLEHNGRLALICFLAHRSHRPMSPDLEDVEMGLDSSPSSTSNSVMGDLDVVPNLVGNDNAVVNLNHEENGNAAAVPEENENLELNGDLEMDDQQSSSSASTSSGSSSSGNSQENHLQNLQFLLESDPEISDADYEPENALNAEDETTSSNSSNSSMPSTGDESMDDEDGSTDSDQDSTGDHNFLNLLQVLEAAAADDSETSSSYVEADRATRRVLMISANFLRSFFAGHDIILKADCDYQNFDLILEWQGVGASMFLLNAKTLSVLIKLSNLRKIHITSYAIFGDRPVNVSRGMQSWMLICRALKESKSLESISLEIGQTRPSPYRIFFDMIPDKLKEVKAKTSIVHALAKRNCILDEVHLFDCTKKHPDYGQIFRTKTKLLDLSRCSSVMLNDLANVGFLSNNPHMEELKIGVLLKDSNDQNRILRRFEKKNWAKLKEALLCLKMVNGDMRLTLITGVFYGDRVKNLKFGIEAMKQAFGNSKQLIDLAKEAGFQLHKVKICDLVLCSRHCPKNTLQQMAKSVGLKTIANDGALTDSVVHDGIEISIKLCYGTPQFFSDWH